MSNMIISYTREIPSAIYRYVPGSGKVDLVFKDRNTVISYPISSPKGLSIATKTLSEGKEKVTVCKNK
jgi:hypothetical protein